MRAVGTPFGQLRFLISNARDFYTKVTNKSRSSFYFAEINSRIHKFRALEKGYMNSFRIIFLIFPLKNLCCDPSLEVSCLDSFYEG